MTIDEYNNAVDTIIGGDNEAYDKAINQNVNAYIMGGNANEGTKGKAFTDQELAYINQQTNQKLAKY